ncbi:MAG: c-type cytochrome [Thermoanaerobaculia bacterium]
MRAASVHRSLVLALFVATSTGVLLAQGGHWDWPEKAMNLKVLPEDTSPDRLRATMRGFTGALGVRCTYCHVGEEGKPLSTFDFVSDKNPNKDRAREMMRMLGSIEGHLKRIEPSGTERVGVRCQTCHQGRARPTTLEEELLAAYRKDGRKAIGTRYTELRERYYGGGGLDFGEHSLNNLGYQLLESSAPEDLETAIAVLQLNTEQYPKSGNAWDSLAEAYAKAGRSEIAAIYYRKSVEVDPRNEHALQELRALAAGEAKSGGE